MELIQTEDITNTKTAVQKAKTKRNTRVQEWRRCKKYEKRQAVFVQEYVEAKYRAINDESMTFYNSLNVLYPTKHDLRKTKEFKKWKKAISGQPTKKSSRSSAKKTQHNSGPAATNQEDSQDNSGPAATNQEDSQDNSGPAATNQEDSQDNSGPAATNQEDNQESTATTGQVDVEVLPPLQVTEQYINQIIQDLRNDPDLNTFFNEIEIEMQDDDVFW